MVERKRRRREEEDEGQRRGRNTAEGPGEYVSRMITA